MLVLDTEVYSNTGGQMSKATPRGGRGQVRRGRQAAAKKDLGLMAMSYGTVYVARVAMGANDAQTLNAFLEAEAYDGPSLIIAYSHCIAHGYDMAHGLEQQKLAVQTGYWPLIRYDPGSAAGGQEPTDSRLQGAVAAAEAVRLQRNPLHHAGAEPARTRPATCCGWRSRMCAIAGTCTKSWRRRRREEAGLSTNPLPRRTPA